MPIATHTLQGDFSALVGEVTSLRATIHANGADQSWINETDLKVVLGSALLPVAADGTFTVTLPTSTGTGLQYEVRAVYVDNGTRMRGSWTSGWFNLTANGNLATLANDSSLRVNPSLGEQLAARIDGYLDHGDISGAVTFDGPIGSHWFDATAATTITLDGFSEGQVVSLLCFTGADNVTVVGMPDLELSDGLVSSAILARGAWVTGGGGGTPATPDTTPPSAVTDLVATGGSEQITLAWSAAVDPESSVSYRYRVWLTSAGAAGGWTSTSSTSATITGLPAGAYTAEVYAYSAGGSTVPDTATATVTAPLAIDFLDTFSRPAGNLSTAATPDTGGTWAGSTANPQITAGGKLTAAGGEQIYATRGSNPARELTFDITTTSGTTTVVTAWAASSTFEGPRVAILTNGQVSFQYVTDVTYNVTGGTNNFTPAGYLAAGNHTVKVETLPGGVCHLTIDGTLVISANYNTGYAGRHVGVMLNGTIDNIQVKS